MSPRRAIDRRTLLRGAGSIAIGLPLLEEMAPGAANAAVDAPVRLVTLFFGLGLYPNWSQAKFAGPLGPFEPLQGKLAFFTNLNMNPGSGGAHCENSAVVFVGEKEANANRSNVASIDQIVRQAVAPTASTLVSGNWWRRGACDGQALRVWNPDGTARTPIKRPSKVFEAVFGSATPPVTDPNAMPDPAATRERHVRRSVLDTVIAQYDRLRGPTSYLGQASRQKLELHLQSIREIEQKLAPTDETINSVMSSVACTFPAAPTDPNIGADYDQFTYGTGSGAPELALQDIEKLFQMHSDLYVMGLTCDLVRYGNLMFESAGGHMNLKGSYSAMGLTTDFPGTSQHDSYFHADVEEPAKLYQHFAMKNLMYFLDKLDAVKENDKTLLDNTTVVIGTEYGKNHSSTGVFHAVAGGRGRFKPGFYTQSANVIDLYNIVLKAHNLPATIGMKTGVQSQGDFSGALV